MMYRSISALFGAIQLAVVAPAFAQRPAAPTDTLRLSIEEAVSTGLRVGDEVRLAAASADIADAQFEAARSTLMPTLRVNSTFGRTFDNARSSAVNPVFAQTNAYTVNANLSQTLFQGGRLYNTARATARLAQASRLDAEERRALFSVEIQRAYLNALLADKLTQLQETNLQLASTRLAQVQQFQAAGRAAQYDVLRARVERANIEPLAIQARNDRELAQLELKRLLNVPLTQPMTLTTTIDPTAAQMLVASYLDSTQLQPTRPGLRAAELTASSRRLAVAAARSEFLPTITAFIQTGFGAFPPATFGIPTERGNFSVANCSDPATAPARGCQNGGWFVDRSLGVNFSWAIFDGMRALSAFQVARATNRIADLELRQEQERIAVEVARARATLQAAKAVFDARRQNSSEAQEAFRLASLRFSRGLSTQLEVSDSQLAMFTAESGEARATYDLYLATAELARALGRPIPLPGTRAPSRGSE